MPSPKTFKRYSAHWLELFYEFKDEPNKNHHITCPNPKAANALRLEFYKAREVFLSDPGMKDEFEAALNSREVRVEGNVVLFTHKDENWIGKLIKASLDAEKAPDGAEGATNEPT